MTALASFSPGAAGAGFRPGDRLSHLPRKFVGNGLTGVHVAGTDGRRRSRLLW
jgi:hypothetical protein